MHKRKGRTTGHRTSGSVQPLVLSLLLALAILFLCIQLPSIRSRTSLIRSAAMSTAVDTEAAKAQLHKVNEDLAVLKAQVTQLKEAGKMDELKALFPKMSALDSESLKLTLELARDSIHASSAAAAPRPLAIPPLSDLAHTNAADVRRRAAGAILGALVADASAMAVEWIYEPAVLDGLNEKGGNKGLAFYEPVSSPFLSATAYSTGALTPYGEHLLALVESLVEAKGIDAGNYALVNFKHFDTPVQAARYRDSVTKTFLRNFAGGAQPPATGADDSQAMACCRAAPLAVLYGGSASLFPAVESAIRVTQNNDKAVAFGQATAAVIERILKGRDPLASLTETVQQLNALAEGGAKLPYREVASKLDEVLQALGTAPADFTAKTGRDCSLPQGVQNPLHVSIVTYLAHKDAGADGKPNGAIYAEAIQRGILGAGDVASRSCIVGAILGAYLGPEAIPAEWMAKVPHYGEWRRLVEELVALRH